MAIEKTNLPIIKYERIAEEPEGYERIDEIVEKIRDQLQTIYSKKGKIPGKISVRLKETGPTPDQIILIAFIKLFAAYGSFKTVAQNIGIPYQVLMNFIHYKNIPRAKTLKKIKKWREDPAVNYELSCLVYHILSPEPLERAKKTLSEEEWRLLEPTIKYYSTGPT